jgi:peptidyl-prolyl cis-trans isomerase C
MKTIIKEPLFHFILLGAAVFIAHRWVSKDKPTGDGGESADVIEVSAAQAEHLRHMWMRQWQRPPTESELRGLVQEHIREEVLCRQALRMGLEQDDMIVRRRLAQKMEFLTQDVANLRQPDDAELLKFLADNSERYQEPGPITFTHVYFSNERRKARSLEDAKGALAALVKSPEAAEETGDAFLLGHDLVLQTRRQIIATFGNDFAASVALLPQGRGWHGPVASAYGWHLVRVTQRGEPHRPELARVRDAVLRDYQDDQRRRANRELFEELRRRYRITVDEEAIKRIAQGDSLAEATR